MDIFNSYVSLPEGNDDRPWVVGMENAKPPVRPSLL